MSKSDPDSIRFECLNCSKVMRASVSMRGKFGKCPRCGNRIQIPGAKKSKPRKSSKPTLPKSETPSVTKSAPAANASATARNAVRDATTASSGIQVLESRAVWAVWFLRTTMFVMAIGCFLIWCLYESPDDSALGIAYTQLVLFGFQIVLTIFTAVFYLQWKYQAYANLEKVCEAPLKTTPGWCCGSYFIPFVNLFSPARDMHEIQSRSKADVSTLVYVWWTCWILSGILGRLVWKANLSFEQICVVEISGLSLTIVAGFFLIGTIKAVTEKQRRYRLANSGLSIDQWQDNKLTPRNWFNIDTVAAALSLICLLSLGAMSASRVGRFSGEKIVDVEMRAEAESDKAMARAEALNEKAWPSKDLISYWSDKANYDPSQKTVVKDEIMKALGENPHKLLKYSSDMEMFSIWFDSDDTKRISPLLKNTDQYMDAQSLVKAMSKVPDSVPAMILELGKRPGIHASNALKKELHDRGVDWIEISRQLSTETLAPQKFEQLVFALGKLASDSRDPEQKHLVASSIAAGGRNLKPEQIEKMDNNIFDAILHFAKLPESADLLEKLVATSKKGAQKVAAFLRINVSEDAGRFAIKLVRQDKINPAVLLDYPDLEPACELLWKAKLKENPVVSGKAFNRWSIPLSDVSMRALSTVATSMIETDPDTAIDSLASLHYKNGEISADALSEKFLEQIDVALSSKIKKDFALLAKSSKYDTSTNRDRRKPPACLQLAEYLGGKKSALAIAEAGRSSRVVLMEFETLVPVLAEINEPQTYDVIVEGYRYCYKSKLRGKNLEAIEPAFLNRLKLEVEKLNDKDKSHQGFVRSLIGWLENYGTNASIPTLEKLTNSKFKKFQKYSQTAINKIRRRDRTKTTQSGDVNR